ADRGLGGGDLGAGRFRLAHDHVFELFEPLGGDRHDIGSLLSNRCPGLLWSRPSILTVGFDQKTGNIPAIVARSDRKGAGRAPESLTSVGNSAIFHWVRSRLGAGLPRSPQDSAGPKGSRTLEFWSFSGPTQARAADRLAGDRDRQGNGRSAAQVPGRQCQAKGAGGPQRIGRLKATPGAEQIASRTRPDC